MEELLQRAFPRGIEVKELPGRGNGVVTVDGVESDAVVGTELPTAWCIDLDAEGSVCRGCLKEADLERCGVCGCGGCCSECDAGIEPGHPVYHDNSECKAFRAIDQLIAVTAESNPERDSWDLNELTLLCRLLFRLRRVCGTADKGHPVWGLSAQPCMDKDKHELRKVAGKISAKVTKTERADMVRLAGIVETNCYSLTIKQWYRPSAEHPSPGARHQASVGIAVYPALSMFNHSCAPNVVKSPVGLKMHLTTLNPLPPGTELTHSYIRPNQTTSRRRDDLISWGFKCSCDRCRDALNTWDTEYLCSCGGYLINDPSDGVQLCHACGDVV